VTPEERKAAIVAMAARMVWVQLTHDNTSPQDDAEAALDGLLKFMDNNGVVFYKP